MDLSIINMILSANKFIQIIIFFPRFCGNVIIYLIIFDIQKSLNFTHKITDKVCNHVLKFLIKKFKEIYKLKDYYLLYLKNIYIQH